MAPNISIAVLVLGFWAVPIAGRAGVYLTGDEALALALPGCQITRTTVYLTDRQKKLAEAVVGTTIDADVINPYEASCPGGGTATAYFDVHRVRTLPQRLMIVVDGAGHVRRIEVLSFDEPADYLPRLPWLRQFLGRGLGDHLEIGGAVRGIAGATITSRATSAAVRRVLALHQATHVPRPSP